MPHSRFTVLLLSIEVALLFCNAQASSVHKRSDSPGVSSQSFVYFSEIQGGLGLPSSPDNWRGGSGSWSNGSDWSAGLPGSNSDVTINTGNDTVTLDTNSTINTLTLGGSSGTSQLTGDGHGHSVTIAGALTVNQSGSLSMYGDTYTAGASSANFGHIDLENAASLQVRGDFNNARVICVACNAMPFTQSSGTIAISGAMSNSGTINLGVPFNGAREMLPWLSGR